MKNYSSDRNILIQHGIRNDYDSFNNPNNENMNFNLILKEYEKRIEQIKRDKNQMEILYKSQLESIREEKSTLEKFCESKIKEYEMIKLLDQEEIKCQRILCQELEKEILQMKAEAPINNAFSISTRAFSPKRNYSEIKERYFELETENKIMKKEISEMKSDLLLLGELQQHAETLVKTNKELNLEIDALRRSNYENAKEKTVQKVNTDQTSFENIFRKEIMILENRLKEEYQSCKKWRNQYFQCQQECEELKEREKNIQIAEQRETLLIEKGQYQEEVLLDFLDKEESFKQTISNLEELVKEQRDRIESLDKENYILKERVGEFELLSLDEIKGRAEKAELVVEKLLMRNNQLELELNSKDTTIFDFREMEAKCELLQVKNSRLEKEVNRIKTSVNNQIEWNSPGLVEDNEKNFRKSLSIGRKQSKDISNLKSNRIEISPQRHFTSEKDREIEFHNMKKKFEEIASVNRKLNRFLVDEQRQNSILQEKIGRISKRTKV